MLCVVRCPVLSVGVLCSARVSGVVGGVALHPRSCCSVRVLQCPHMRCSLGAMLCAAIVGLAVVVFDVLRVCPCACACLCVVDSAIGRDLISGVTWGMVWHGVACWC